MKLVKILLLSIVFTLTSALAVLNYQKDNLDNYKSPLDNEQNDYYQKLKFALNSNNINLSTPITINSYTDKINFSAITPQNNQVTVVLTSQKDPYIQSASLQKIFSEATIKGKYVNYIDLSLNHPYVTLQNN